MKIEEITKRIKKCSRGHTEVYYRSTLCPVCKVKLESIKIVEEYISIVGMCGELLNLRAKEKHRAKAYKKT